ncbi:protein regulator of cytokinesis 1-like [Trichogramma pretiosum]|uniref:protein regulator of cytokinesis 1-like n=1 Tax=Trichogramma pretiosum TaxID=7493 RepID=UPI0006C946D6|nr:protein regulator of cytokinesis 1-like [Trichogramma pretiosum]
MSSIRDNTIEKAKSICAKQISELFDIWEETGYREKILSTYADQVLNHVVELMKDMVEESNQKKKDLLKNVKTLIHTARKISKELGTNFATEAYDDLPLIELEILLKEQVDQLQHLKDQRLKYIEELLAKESEICKKIGAKIVGFNNALPSEQEIKEFENYLNIQEMEMTRLSDLFKDSRRSILKMMEDLQATPALNFERMVCHDHNNFVFSPSNMSLLRDLRERLKEQVDAAKSEAQEKKETLKALWDYLDEPAEHRQHFLETYTGYSRITLNALNVEIKRCKEKRSENVANYVKKVRCEIENYWKLCKFSELQKKSFTAMKCQTYTDDLLTLHEMEAESLKKYYNNNKKIFELLDEWEIQFEKLKELDQRANDPDRYHNRGGQLLMEEKERKAAEKKLPKLEAQLDSLIEDYEKLNKKAFTVHGLSLKEYMNEKRENYEVEKENLKLARKQAKDKSAKKTPLSTSKRTPGASMLRVTPASNRLRTPGPSNMSRMTPAAKRKLPYDVSPNTSNKKRMVSTEKHKPTLVVNKVRRSGRKKTRRSKNDTMLSVSSYGNFQEHLENRDELRSSILPEETVLRKGSNMGTIKTPMKTPMKTPLKPVRRKVVASTPAGSSNARSLRSTPRSPKIVATPH